MCMKLNKGAYDAFSAELEDLIQSVEIKRKIILRKQKVFFSSHEILLILNNS